MQTTWSSFEKILDGMGPINDVSLSLALWTPKYIIVGHSHHMDMSFDDKEFSCRVQTKTALLFWLLSSSHPTSKYYLQTFWSFSSLCTISQSKKTKALTKIFFVLAVTEASFVECKRTKKERCLSKPDLASFFLFWEKVAEKCHIWAPLSVFFSGGTEQQRYRMSVSQDVLWKDIEVMQAYNMMMMNKICQA